MAMGEIKYDDYTEEEQALMKGAPYVMKPLQGQDDASCQTQLSGADAVSPSVSLCGLLPQTKFSLML